MAETSSQGLAHVSSQQKHRAVPSQSSANSECLPRADTWVRPYDDTATLYMNRFFGVLVKFFLFSPKKWHFKDKLRQTISSHA